MYYGVCIMMTGPFNVKVYRDEKLFMLILFHTPAILAFHKDLDDENISQSIILLGGLHTDGWC